MWFGIKIINLYVWFLWMKISYEQHVEEKKTLGFGALDLRIGRIIVTEKHPHDEKYYKLKVHFGKSPSRTILCGLAKLMNQSELQDRLTPVILNSEPFTVKNITSQGVLPYVTGIDSEEDFVMTEILDPPQGTQPDDVVVVEGIEYKPEKQLDSDGLKSILADLMVDRNKIAKYKRKQYLNVSGKGIILSQWVKLSPMLLAV